jgi:hypothetical protein
MDYAKNRDKERALTVSELMQERAYNPQLANQNSVFEVVNNAIGIDNIKDDIVKTIKGLGTISRDSSQYASRSEIEQQIKSFQGQKLTSSDAADLQKLQQIVNSPGDYFKIDHKEEYQINPSNIDNAFSII